MKLMTIDCESRANIRVRYKYCFYYSFDETMLFNSVHMCWGSSLLDPCCYLDSNLKITAAICLSVYHKIWISRLDLIFFAILSSFFFPLD